MLNVTHWTFNVRYIDRFKMPISVGEDKNKTKRSVHILSYNTQVVRHTLEINANVALLNEQFIANTLFNSRACFGLCDAKRDNYNQYSVFKKAIENNNYLCFDY